jgi:hypothetical protein
MAISCHASLRWGGQYRQHLRKFKGEGTMWRYRIASLLFHMMHSSIVIFSVTGWMFTATRPYHIVIQSIIFVSWYVLGLWYYPGYCISTDYHFRILRKLGVDPGSQSYIKYLIDTLTPFRFEEKRLDRVIVVSFFTCYCLSVILYLFPDILKHL